MNIPVRVFAFIMKLFGYIALPFQILFNPYNNNIKVPPATNPLLNIPVVVLVQKLRNKEVIIWQSNKKSFQLCE